MVMFRKRHVPLDWKSVASGRSVDAVVRDPSDQSINEIQRSLENITFGKIKSKALPELDVIIKGFEYAQLTIEYLLNVQESLSSALSNTQKELDEERARADDLQRKEKKSRSNTKKLKECQATLQAASYMLTQFGVETAPLRRMCEDGLRGAKAPDYVWVPAFLDPYDGKAFQSAEFLKKHLYSKNVDAVKSDLNSGKYSAPTDYDLTVAMSKSMDMSSMEEVKPPQPRDEVEAASQRLVLDLGGSVSANISRKVLLKEFQFLRTHPDECPRYHFPLPSANQDISTTVHDLLASHNAVNVVADVNSEILLDWRGVDAHLRTLLEVDNFLRTDLQRSLAEKLSKTAQEANMNFEMKQTQDLDARALKLFRELDVNGDGSISLEEFLNAVLDPKKGSGLRTSLGFPATGHEDNEKALAFIRAKMKEMDSDGDGLISLLELKSFLERVAFFNDGFTLGKEIGFASGIKAGEQISEQSKAQLEEQQRLWAQRVTSSVRESSEKDEAPPQPLSRQFSRASSRFGDNDDGELLESVAYPDAMRLFAQLDRNGDGQVSLVEFANAAMSGAMSGLLGLDESLSQSQLVERIKLLDENGDGYLSFEEVSRFIDRSRAFSIGYNAGVRDSEANQVGQSNTFFMEAPEQPPVTTMVTTESDSAGAIVSMSPVKEETYQEEEDSLVVDDAALEEMPEASNSELWFEFSVVGASNLRSADSNGFSDPLAVVKVNGKEVFSTKCVGKTLNPRWAVSGDEGMVKLVGLDLTDDSLEVSVELWDQDGVIFRSRDFLGVAILKRKHLLDPSNLGQGPVSFPLVPGKETGQDASLGITGRVHLCWRAKATVRVGMIKATGLRNVERRGMLGGLKPPAPPEAVVRFSCEGCKVVDAKKEKKATCAHIYSTNKCKAGVNPVWDEYKSVIVPLDRLLEGGLMEVLDGPSGQVIGVAHISTEILLSATKALVKDTIDNRKVKKNDIGENDSNSLTLNLIAPSEDKNQHNHAREHRNSHRTEGTLSISIDAPPGLSEFYQAGRRNAQELARHVAPPLECMEVEVECLSASGLAKKKEAFVKVLLNGVPVGKRSKARPTSFAPVFGGADGNRFVVSIPFPKELAAISDDLDKYTNLVPDTIVTVQLWDENKITRNELLGEVELRWPQLIHASIKTWPLADPRVWHHDASGVLKRGARAHGGTQGVMKIRLRQLQCFQVTVLGAYGLRPADGGHNSDPFAVLKLSREGESKAAKAMRTSVVSTSLEPVWLHHFMFSKALDPTDSSIDKHERKRRREVCKSSKPNGDALFPGLWAETTGAPSMISSCTSFQSFAIQGDRLLPSDPAEPNQLRALRNKISLEICLWDKDDFSSNDFLGVVSLTEADLRQPRAGVHTLRLQDDPRRNKEGETITGWIELKIQSSIAPEIVEDSEFRRVFPPPDCDMEPVIGVRVTNLSGSSLNPADTNGKSDPYAVISANGVMFGGQVDGSVLSSPIGLLVDHCTIGETEVINRNLNPKWQTPFEVLMPLDEAINPPELQRVQGEEKEGDGTMSNGLVADAASPTSDIDGESLLLGSSLEVRIFDKDTFGSDDFLGFAKFDFRELLGISPLPEGGKILGPDPRDVDESGKPKQVKKRSFEFFSCRYVDILPPAGNLSAVLTPLARLHLSLIGARGLTGANMNGLSDPYIRIRCLGNICPHAGGREGFFRLGDGRKVFKTAVRTGTLNPTWNESVIIPIDLKVLFTSREEITGLSIEIWDEPTVTGHKFLGRVMLDSFLISQMLTKPEVAPRQCQLVDAPDAQVPKQKKLKKPIQGFLEFHASGSEIPDFLRSHFGCSPQTPPLDSSSSPREGGGGDHSFALPLSPEGFKFTDRIPLSPIGRRTPDSEVNSLSGAAPTRQPGQSKMIHRPVASHRQRASEHSGSMERSHTQTELEESSEYLEEQARVELLIREAAKLNLEARHDRGSRSRTSSSGRSSSTSSIQSTTPPHSVAAPPDVSTAHPSPSENVSSTT